MVKRLFSVLLLITVFLHAAHAQEDFTIKKYDVAVTVNKDASLDIEETIDVHFTTDRHGILRYIPYKYPLASLPEGTEKADRQLSWGNYTYTIIENIGVEHWEYNISKEGDYKVIKIGSADKYVHGDQQYVIHYRMLNAINFFKDYSELYLNIIGDKWATTIDSVHFSIVLYDALPQTPFYFVATGPAESKENNTRTNWMSNKILSGVSTRSLGSYEGMTVGIRFPKNFLVQPDYRFRGIAWLLLSIVVFAVLFYTWKRLGKDEEVTIKTEYYPPQNVSPCISGYIIDDKLNRRDLTALVPYWGAGGYLQVSEVQNPSFLGLIKTKDYLFTKLKELPLEAMTFERTLFDGIFKSGSQVALKDLRNVLYKTMAEAKKQLEREVNKQEYYVKGSREIGYAFVVAGFIIGAYGVVTLMDEYGEKLWFGISLLLSALSLLFFGYFMSKRSRKGTLLYQQLAGFREFIRSVEKDRIRTFLKQDEHYFDKILPYAIVFDVADTWKDKLEGLDIPPPSWYRGNYTTFNTHNFMRSLDHSLNTMSATFYSAPSKSGGSFGSGGSSGGGFGGGGGSSW